MSAPVDAPRGTAGLPEAGAPVAIDLPVVMAERRRRGQRRRRSEESGDNRGIISPADWQRPTVRRAMGVLQVVMLIGLVIVGLGPILWLAKSAITPTQDTLRTPMQLFPNGFDWQNLSTAWNKINIAKYFVNTVVIAFGCWLIQILIATTAGYAFSVLRPKYGKVLYALVLATLFVPTIVLLIPLYLTMLNPPVLHTSLLNTYWAVWLPAGANAFNVVLVKRFIDSLPREIFEAAKMDGAGPFRMFLFVVLPLSKPILGVVSVFAIMASWKDFLWPLLVLPNPDLQPLSVRLPTLQPTTELDVFLAALFLSMLLPIVIFLVFQRLFLRGAGLSGAVKG